ncbi:class I SAM-dependent methyltransferase [Phenylobacterium sp.]|uniref:class I SAM-dependent methyltransferase n=1 Tax=Phenylobacterium sp. TaxID=1871053 RepID=UPI0035B3A1ED
MATVTYNPGVFDVADLDAARRIILTPDQALDTDTRWARETPYFGALLAAHLMPGPEHLVLDYGCGVGRLSKELIERSGCRVLGVDISASMRRMALDYVGSDRFEAISPEAFEARVRDGVRVDGAFAVWVIQHTLDPRLVVDAIASSLSPEGRLVVVNSLARCVPAVEKPWARDGVDVRALLRERLLETGFGSPDPRHVGEPTARTCWWGVYWPRTPAP